MPFLSHPPIQHLIQALPVDTHSVEVRAQDWRSPFELAHQEAIHEAIFAGRPSVRVSRRWFRESPDLAPAVRAAGILLWGYPQGARGGRHRHWIRCLPELAQAASNRALPWPEYESHLHALGGLGISTISKLAYGFGCTFGERPALVLDQRIIRVVHSGRWSELAALGDISYAHAGKRYPEYLDRMAAVSEAGGYLPVQLEFFLFALGDSF